MRYHRAQTIVVSVRAELRVLDEWEMGTFLTAIGIQYSPLGSGAKLALCGEGRGWCFFVWRRGWNKSPGCFQEPHLKKLSQSCIVISHFSIKL